MSKKEGPHDQQSNFADKSRPSLVFKLNLQMLGMLLAGFMSINILLSLLFFGHSLWQAEIGAQNILDALAGEEYTHLEEFIKTSGYEIVEDKRPTKAFRLPAILQKRLPIATPHALRSFTMPIFGSQMTLLEHMEQVTYSISLTIDHVPTQITYALGTDLRRYFLLLIVVLVFELFFFLGRIFTNTRVLRKTLRPLSEMAETTRSLQKKMTSLGSANGDIKHLAGAISTIDAKQLNRQLSVDSSQVELKDLADAINEMLNRINQSYQSQVRFVSDASHELRTPISVIQGYANLLDRWGKNDEKTLQESIDAIKSETNHMKGLVEQLLFLARGDNESIQIHKTVFDACTVIEEIIREARLIDPAHTFETQLKGPNYLEADQQLIKQAIRILVDNSMKYTPPGEKILLRSFTKDNTVNIQVQDHGIGIAPEDVSRIFHRFYRSDESRARKTGGSGLGLAIAKWIIEYHEGYYEVLSRQEIGTRTTLILPVAREIPEPERTHTPVNH